MKSLFKYIDYRSYLEDYYNEKKRTMRSFSYRYFAMRAGIKSPNFLKQIIEGERNLTRRTIDQFIKALNLNKKESQFFKNLVFFNQAKTAQEKQEHYSTMLHMMDYITENRLTIDHYRYFDKWYTSVLRELICLYDFKDNFSRIAKTVYPSISTIEVRESVALLLRLKLIAKQKDGTYRQTSAAIISDNPMVALARRSFNSAMLERARYANETIGRDERNISGITMGISKRCYDVILTEMAAFKERIKVIVNQDSKSSWVYQLNMQLFPLSSDVLNLPPETEGTSGAE